MRKLPKEVRKIARLTPPLETLRIPILMYHYIEYVKDQNDTIRRSLAIEPNILDQQIKTLSDSGYTFLTAS